MSFSRFAALVLCWFAGSGVAWGQTDTAQCEAPRDCELMWAAAHDAIALVSTMPIRNTSDARIETAPPNGPGRTGAVATKVARATGGYEFRIRIDCSAETICADIRASGTMVFNAKLRSAVPFMPAKGDEARLAPQTVIVKRDEPPEARSTTRRAESLPEALTCATKPSARLLGQRPGFDTFVIACASGDALVIGCEAGVCRVLK